MTRPYFDINSLRLMIFYFAFAVWAIPEFLGSFFQRSGSGSARRDRGSWLVLLVTLYGGMAVAFFLAFRLPATDIAVDPALFFYSGILLILAGVAFRWYAIRILGRFFTRDVATHTGQTVVRQGPYRLIRHPSYAGALITVVGVGLALTNWASLVALVAISLVGYMYRISIEEHALLDAIGQPYREYMRTTRRLIPFIW